MMIILATQANNSVKGRFFVNKIICVRVTIACLVKQQKDWCLFTNSVGLKDCTTVMDRCCCQANAEVNLKRTLPSVTRRFSQSLRLWHIEIYFPACDRVRLK